MAKSSLVETKQTSGSIMFNCVCGSENCSTTSSPFFPFNTLNSLFYQMHCAFYMKRYRNRSIWISVWYHFSDISILFNSLWDPMEATFSSWILSSELSGTQNLKASSLRHKYSCIYHMQTFFMEGSIVRQLYWLFVFFWLARFAFRCFGPFLFCAMSESGFLTFNVVSFS